VHFVDEQHRLPRRTQIPACLVEHRADILDTGRYRRQLNKPRITLATDYRCDRRLADARRPPEEDRHGLAIGQPTQR
jgi:hypothetical protein